MQAETTIYFVVWWVLFEYSRFDTSLREKITGKDAYKSITKTSPRVFIPKVKEKNLKKKCQKNYRINNNKPKIKMARYSRWITGHFSQDHLPFGKKAVNELHVLGFFGFLLLSRTRVIPCISVKPAVPRAVLQALGFIRRYLAPFVTMFILALYPNGDGIFLWYSRRAT